MNKKAALNVDSHNQQRKTYQSPDFEVMSLQAIVQGSSGSIREPGQKTPKT
jgi:hypothetical protein